MYCNYSKDKFGNEITFIIPCWTTLPEGSIELGSYDGRSIKYKDDTVYEDTPMYPEIDFVKSLCESEMYYLQLLDQGWKPQQARAVLPNALKTELVMTGFVSDWEHFFSLRALGTTGAPHPQAKELAEPLMEEFIARKYINN